MTAPASETSPAQSSRVTAGSGGAGPTPAGLADGLVDVMIPVLNEAGQVAAAVRNGRRLGAVFVLDGGSTDGTPDVARAAGATVVVRPFAGHSAFKNWGLGHLPFAAPWVFVMDADERLTPALVREVRRAADPAARRGAGGPPRADVYTVDRRLIFMGRAIRHGGLFPARAVRLFRRGRAWYDGRAAFEQVVGLGPVGRLTRPLLHLRQGPLSDYIARAIRLADAESDEWVARALARERRWPGSVTAAHWWWRRPAGPAPGRAVWRLVSMFVLRLGFLDGPAGWHLARLAANYEYMFRLMYRDKLDRALAAAADAGRPPPGR